MLIIYQLSCTTGALDVGHLPARRRQAGVLVRGRAGHGQARHHRRALHHGQEPEEVQIFLAATEIFYPTIRSFLSRQFTVRVGEWNLADQDNYSEELQVETLCILYLDIYQFYSISSLHINTIIISTTSAGGESRGPPQLQTQRVLQRHCGVHPQEAGHLLPVSLSRPLATL